MRLFCFATRLSTRSMAVWITMSTWGWLCSLQSLSSAAFSSSFDSSKCVPFFSLNVVGKFLLKVDRDDWYHILFV